jgi:hypothetical protein
MADSVATNAGTYARDTQKAFGRELENLRENDWSFSNYTRPKDKEDS